jgi:hypothetical protein
MNPYRYEPQHLEAKMDPMTREESTAWSNIENSFRSTKLISPRKGFTNRWMHLQRQHARADQRHREAWLALGNGTAILAILFVIALTVFPVLTQQGTILSSLFEFVLDSFTFVIVAIDVLFTFIQALPLLAWFVIALAFFSLVALWASLFSRVAVGNR